MKDIYQKTFLDTVLIFNIHIWEILHNCWILKYYIFEYMYLKILKKIYVSKKLKTNLGKKRVGGVDGV